MRCSICKERIWQICVL